MTENPIRKYKQQGLKDKYIQLLLSTDKIKVVHYPYRTARVIPVEEEYNREDFEVIEKFLADMVKVTRDNHTVYSIIIKQTDDNLSDPIHFWFHDDYCHVGRNLEFLEIPESVINTIVYDNID